MKAKTAIYTAIFGNKDCLKPPAKSGGYDYIVFTDNEQLISDDYIVVNCPPTHDDPTRNARRYKVLAHQFLPDYQYSLWVDANIEIGGIDIDGLFSCYLKNYDIALHKHPLRNCIYDEASRCVEINKDNPSVIQQQMQKYRDEGYPPQNGLVSTGILYRKHTPQVAQFNACWWQEIKTHSRRDQLSFNYVAWKSGVSYHVIESHVRLQNVEGFTIVSHDNPTDYKNW